LRPPLALILALLATPALAWEVSTDGPVCVLTHAEADIALRLTYDPGPPLYTITLTRTESDWPDAPVFALQFAGPQPNLISTDRHVTDGPALTVTDRGFGNVLDGLQFNDTATALIGDAEISIPLEDAAAAIATFRACTSAPSA
jgi:hypothetical protein